MLIACLYASSENKEEFDEAEKKRNMSPLQILFEYGEHTTVQGLVYLILNYQTTFGKTFWSIMVLFMTILGCYWCMESYINWSQQPGKLTEKVEIFQLIIAIF